MTPARDELLAFELALDEQVCDEVHQEGWGRLFLTPSTPLVWDANWVGIEQVETGLDEVVAVADAALGGAGFAHRTVCVLDQADGRQLGEELEAEPARWPGWEIERVRYMVWRGGPAESLAVSSHLSGTIRDNCELTEGARAAETPTTGAREVRLDEIEPLRRALLAEEMPPEVDEPEATVDQLFELDGRYGKAGGDRWFVAPAEAEPMSACRLLRKDGIGQVEDVGTRERARNRGYAKAIVLAAVAFLTAEADDWPQLLYARLGFETVGDLTILRRRF